MPLSLTVLNNSTGASALVTEGGSTGAIDVHDADSIAYGGSGANAGKKIDLQKSPDGSTWSTWQTATATAYGDFSFLNETMPTPVPATHYRRVVSRTT